MTSTLLKETGGRVPLELSVQRVLWSVINAGVQHCSLMWVDEVSAWHSVQPGLKLICQALAGQLGLLHST